MIGISSKGNYGIIIMFALAKNHKQGLLQINHIARTRKIPRSYLIQLLNKLKKAGLIDSVRGNRGGYKLAHDPDKITVLDVIESLEGRFSIFRNYPFDDAVQDLYDEAENSIKSIMSCTLEDLLHKQESRENKTMYYI
jgi:Rrf2 family cysteine metabolism transcriptional repressor